ncbi:hypothetical protein GCM10010121_099690 [Streptomyces brasiliensis]|uniref:Uncharacterized protein n=2 Tax=Streptomyces brasiliensis TaxID=1954 RepID=A0A917PEW9_9ACTN|nr:hypothetical protein GCM10010121_099690 [Streptomyces brasiliensis]
MLPAKADMLSSGALNQETSKLVLQARENSRARQGCVRRLTPAADTNKHEQQRSAADLSGRSAEAQSRLTDVDGPL